MLRDGTVSVVEFNFRFSARHLVITARARAHPLHKVRLVF